MWFKVMVLQAQASMFFTTHFLRTHIPLFAIYIAKSTHHGCSYHTLLKTYTKYSFKLLFLFYFLHENHAHIIFWFELISPFSLWTEHGYRWSSTRGLQKKITSNESHLIILRLIAANMLPSLSARVMSVTQYFLCSSLISSVLSFFSLLPLPCYKGTSVY